MAEKNAVDHAERTFLCNDGPIVDVRDMIEDRIDDFSTAPKFDGVPACSFDITIDDRRVERFGVDAVIIDVYQLAVIDEDFITVYDRERVADAASRLPGWIDNIELGDAHSFDIGVIFIPDIDRANRRHEP